MASDDPTNRKREQPFILKKTRIPALEVQLCKHPPDNVNYNLSHRVQSVNIDLSTQRPWESATLVLLYNNALLTRATSDGPFDAISGDPTVPVPGDWIVIFAPGVQGRRVTGTGNQGPEPTQPTALFWGHVAAVDFNATATNQGVVDAQRVRVQVESWLEFMGRQQVIVAPYSKRTIGTFLVRDTKASVSKGRRSWSNLIDGLLDQLSPDTPGALGKSLAKVWTELGATRLPPGLGNRRIGDVIPVVYDEETAAQAAPRLTLDPVPGWSLEGLKSIYPQGQSVLDLLLGSFMADQNMVEFYPTLEPYGKTVVTPSGSTPDGHDRGQRAVDAVTPTRFKLLAEAVALAEETVLEAEAARDPTKREALEAANTPPPPTTQAISVLGQKLGVNPVLVYRMRPWRHEPLREYQIREVKQWPYSISDSEDRTRAIVQSGVLEMKARSLDPNIFQSLTWRQIIASETGAPVLRHGFYYDANDVVSWTGHVNTQDAVNFVTVDMPGQADSAIRFLSEAGLPLFHTRAVERHGVRLYQPSWPFWPAFDEVEEKGKAAVLVDLLTSLYTVAVQAMQFVGANHRLFMGQMELNFSPELRPGMNIDAQIPRHGSGTIRAYVERVVHNINITETGVFSARTIVDYSRGAFEEQRRRDQFVDEEDTATDEQIQKLARDLGGDAGKKLLQDAGVVLDEGD